MTDDHVSGIKDFLWSNEIKTDRLNKSSRLSDRGRGREERLYAEMERER